MSYLIKYQFNPKLEDSREYNKDDLRSETIQVGNLFEEVSLDFLAGKVFSLLAKRNVFVVNLEIFEIVQKPVFFKENEDGISISKKKFKFDDGAKVTGEEGSEEVNKTCNKGSGTDIQVYASKEGQHQDLQTLLANPQVISLLTAALAKSNGGQVHPHQLNAKSQGRPCAAPATLPTGEKILRHEFYCPEDEIFVRSAKKVMPDLSFTHGKQYPILSEKIPQANGTMADPSAGLYYETVDDKGRKVSVRSNLFALVMPKLIGDDEPDVLTGKKPMSKSSDGLYWGGAEKEDMPDIRRR